MCLIIPQLNVFIKEACNNQRPIKSTGLLKKFLIKKIEHIYIFFETILGFFEQFQQLLSASSDTLCTNTQLEKVNSIEICESYCCCLSICKPQLVTGYICRCVYIIHTSKSEYNIFVMQYWTVFPSLDICSGYKPYKTLIAYDCLSTTLIYACVSWPFSLPHDVFMLTVK